jgi:predicted dehydrogenase
MLRIGIAGIGFMGMIHYLAVQRAAGVQVVAIQSRDAKKRGGDWRGIHGNFGPPGAVMDLSGLQRYESLEQLLADPLVDLVDLTVPTPQHEFLAIQALKAGKHVLVEKPIALEVAAADRMIATAKQSGRLLMVAHVLPCFPEFRFGLEVAKSQRYGKLLAGQFTRVIAQPNWSAAVADMNTTGGPAVDLHIHDTHFIRTMAGQPNEVIAVGYAVDGVVCHLTTLYRFADGPALSCSSGALVGAARPFAHGFELYFENATLSFGPGQPLTVIGSTKCETPPVTPDPVAAFTYELERVAASVAAGVAEPFLAAETARDALRMCLKEIESVVSRKAVSLTDH